MIEERQQVNVNLQQSNNFVLIINGDEKLKTKDVTFYIKNFTLPNIGISKIMIPNNVNPYPVPGQGKMDYGDITVEMILDDNLNNYFQILKWIHRLKNPGYLWSINNDEENFLQKPSSNNLENLKNTDQYLIDYRDISILISDTNGQFQYKFVFEESFPFELSALQFNSQTADYMSFSVTFAFMKMSVFDNNDNMIV